MTPPREARAARPGKTLPLGVLALLGLTVWSVVRAPDPSGRPEPHRAAVTPSLSHTPARELGASLSNQTAPSSPSAVERLTLDAPEASPLGLGHLLGRAVDGRGNAVATHDATVVVWPSDKTDAEVLDALSRATAFVREVPVGADGSFVVDELPTGSTWRVAIRGTGLFSDDRRSWTARDALAGAGPAPHLVVREVTAGRYHIDDPRKLPLAQPPFGLQLFPVSFSTRGVGVIDPASLAGFLAGVDNWDRDHAPLWNDGFVFSSTALGDRGLGFLGLIVGLPGYSGAVQEVRTAGIRSRPVPETALSFGKPPIRLGELGWAVDGSLAWPAMPHDAPPYWRLDVADGAPSSRLSEGTGIALRPEDLPGGSLTGLTLGDRQVRIQNLLGYVAHSPTIQVTTDRTTLAVIRPTPDHGGIVLTADADCAVLHLSLRTPSAREVRVSLLGPEFRLPFAPPGRYEVRHTDPATLDTASFVVHAGQTTTVDLR